MRRVCWLVTVFGMLGAIPAQGQEPNLNYTPWTKICAKTSETGANPGCFTGRDARTETGQIALSAVLIETTTPERKLLRLTLPLGVALGRGVRVIVDAGPPASGNYSVCVANGCVVEYELSTEVISKLKAGRTLFVQAVSANGSAINVPLPLEGFTKAHDGPPSDPKVLEEQRQKLREQLQKK